MFYGSQNAPQADGATFAWSSLKRFLHTPSLTATLMALHQVPQKGRANVEKQAGQIRQCLVQAREYRDASSLTSLATKPVLMYYSILALALAQIMFKGDGMSSLDKARGKNAHHGLIFKVSEIEKGAYDLKMTASALKAEPMIVNGLRQGTFELWCKQSREDPVVGKLHQRSAAYGTVQNALLLMGLDERYVTLDRAGITFLEVLKGVPGLAKNGLFHSDVVRGSLSFHETEVERRIRFHIHPHSSKTAMEVLKEGIKFAPSCVDHITVFEGEAGFGLEHVSSIDENHMMQFPSASSWTADEARFMPPSFTINEFGYLYLGLYMLGNYARYYPDKWVLDVDQGSPLALAAEAFLNMADNRMALLTLSDLSQLYYVIET